MSWTDDQIDDLARKANEKLSFSYDPAFFKEMETLLPKKKKSLGFLWWITSAVVLAAIGVFWTLNTTQNIEWAVKSMEGRLVNGKRTISSTNIPENVTLAEAKATVEAADVQSRISQKNGTEAILPSVGSKKTQSFEGSTAQFNKNVLPAQSKSLSNGDRNPSTVEKTTVDQGNDETNEPAKTNAPVIEKNDLTSGGTSAANEESNDFSETQSLVLEKEIESKEKEKISTENETRLPVESILLVRGYEPFQFKGVYDGRFTKFPARLYRGTYFYFQGGFSMGQALVENQNKNTKALDFGFGFIHQRGYWSAQAGLSVEFQKADVEMEERTTHYSYDVSNFQNNLYYREFYKLDLPLSIQLHKNKHQMQTGFNLNYLLGSKMQYTFSENTVVKRDETIYGENKGLKLFGAQYTIGYGYSLHKNLVLGANIRVQLTHQLNNQLEHNVATKPLSGNIFIRKTFKR